jgi:hypothetical protein
MSKYLTLFCILGVVALFIVPAYAEVQNIKVGGDITIRGIYRNDYDLQETDITASPAHSDEGGWFMTTTRLRVDADLTDNVSTTIRLLNERDWDKEMAETTDVDLDLAYITLKEILYSPLSVTLGRQEIVLGDGLILANPYPDPRNVPTANAIVADDLSARRAFDAIRAILDYDPWTINLIAVKLAETQNVPSGGSVDNDQDLYVANLGYKFGQYNAEAEGYLAYKRDQAKTLQLTKYDGTGITERRTFEDADIYTLGLRSSLEPVERLTLKGEVAYQFGELKDKSVTSGDYSDSNPKDIDIKAWALDLGGTYAIDYTWSPKIGLKYAYRSGEGNSWSGDYESWDPLYESQVNGVVANALTLGNNKFQLNNTNMNIIGVNASIVPIEGLTVGVDYYRYILDEKLDTGSDISTIYRNDNDYGDEVDISLKYAYTPDVSLGLLYGIFIPGGAFEKKYDDAASQVVGTVKVTF